MTRRTLPVVDPSEGARGSFDDEGDFDDAPPPRVIARVSSADLADRSARALGDDGPIARGLARLGARYESREGQLEMARAVAEAIADERTLLCEAGTGTGKTLAYLVPALLSGRRVVVSTATKALQEQIFTKDVPMLHEHLGVAFQAALMKGLANYLCRRRLEEALGSHSAADARGQQLARLEAWAKDSETGDRAELVSLRDDDPIWREVHSGSDTRIGQGCAFHDRCFVTRMREEAQRSRLVVVNHHLYLADLALRRGGARQGIIPEHDVVVFDEAHQLEEIATDFFGVRVSTARVESFVRDARRALQAAGVITRGASTAAPGIEGEAARLLDGVSSKSQALFASLSATVGTLVLQAPTAFGMRAGGGNGEGRMPLPEEAWTEDAEAKLHALDAALEALAAFAKVHEKQGETREEIAAIQRRATSLRNDLARVVSPRRGDVAWIDVRARSCAIGVSPIDLAPVFRDELWSGTRPWPRTAVLTSATLATAAGGPGVSPFAHAKRRLGLTAPAPREARDPEGLEFDEDDEERTRGFDARPIELLVASPFDYRRTTGAYVPLDLPEPNDPSYVDVAGVRAIELVRASRGGAFVLCASNRHMRGFHARLREANLPYPLFCQGERPKTTLLEEFREAGDGVLVATMGFWEGVDVPGRALRLVIIDKLPFSVPTDPVVSARYRAIEEAGRSPFVELSVPEAAIALKQGFGRLIRTRTDVGVVAILDKRLRTKGYGKGLRAALPPAAPLHHLDDVRRFFELVVGVGT
jgi:ATP-dependent DNA helicase DinG